MTQKVTFKTVSADVVNSNFSGIAGVLKALKNLT